MDANSTTAVQRPTDAGDAGDVEAGSAGEAALGGLTLGADWCPRLNLAMQQHGVPLVRELRLTLAPDARPITEVRVSACLANGEAEPLTRVIDRIEPGETYRLPVGGLTPRLGALAGRTEAERTELTLTAHAGGASTTAAFQIELLAYDEWPGPAYHPELLAAFVTPNHPRVAELLGAARGHLRAAGGPDALDGYQSASRRRALHLAQAGFAAVADRGIGYCNPPASFERSGQRVRLVDRVLRERLGTCLDLALLLAGVWEQAGLHPVLLLPPGHALVGVWTHETHAPDAVGDDPAAIRNRVETGDLIVCETTLLTQPGASFDDAQRAASERLRAVGGEFLAIDVRAARKAGTRPLPLRDADGHAEVDAEAAQAQAAAHAVGGGDRRFDVAERSAAATAAEPAETPEARVRRWMDRLLDLSLRNRLINFRETAKTLRLAPGDVAALEDRLSAGHALRLRPTDDAAMPDDEAAAAAVAEGVLPAAGPVAQAEKALLGLYRDARTHLQETGSNTLYLALGMLVWYESESAETPRHAPLILLPIELRRTSGPRGYAYELALTDEPRRPNITLLQKLAGDFGLDTGPLEELPEDESGVDVEVVLHRARRAIAHLPRWEVEESAYLGVFSFSKFLMWRDLRENLPKLKQNPLVGHLVGGGRTAFAADAPPLPRPEDVDGDGDADGDADGGMALLCTRDADSSQLAAVRAAAEGRTFVLEGPPGTGKSQTIANLIADALGRGRRVLFVAEKMAALSVVRDRLDADGLGDFCLELHAAKANKKDVLAQLGAALAARDAAPAGRWERDRRDLAAARDQLNAYPRQLHAPWPSGETLYEMLGRLVRLGAGPAAAPDTSAPITQTAAATLEGWRRLARELAGRVGDVAPTEDHPLRDVGRRAWGFALEGEAAKQVAAARDSLDKLDAAWRALAEPLGLAGGYAAAEMKATMRLLALAADGPGVPPALVSGADAAAVRRRVTEVAEAGRYRDAARAAALDGFAQEFLDLDPLPHVAAVDQAAASRLLLGWLRRRRALAALRPYRRPGAVPLTIDAARESLAKLREARRARSSFEDVSRTAPEAAALLRRSPDDWAALAHATAFAERFAEATRLMPAGERGAAALARLAEVAGDKELARRLAGPLREAAAGYRAWRGHRDALAGLLEAPDALSRSAATWIAEVREVLERWADGLDRLRPWCAWRDVRAAAGEAGLDALADALAGGTLAPGDAAEALERGYGRAWFNAAAAASDAVRTFDVDRQSSLIDEFRRLDRAVIAATPGAVRRNILDGTGDVLAGAATRPAFVREMGVLRRELEKKSRHKPPRELIAALPNVLPALKRCFLMSPLSVAQYLDAGGEPFDLVVFDEASQIPPWDAVGAMARGRAVVVVGDSKQLPPTSFFGKTAPEEDDAGADAEDVPEDMESILEECNAAQVPSMRLRWHYRSRHESLIAFSNRHYYENALNTFPSPDAGTDRMGVALRHVADGVYDKGGSRTNRREAEAVVAEVLALLGAAAAGEGGASGSVGVVTFNQPQQELIEDLLDQARRDRPEIEPFFGDAAGEAVFVKNLENVQGDERDTILFSPTYGPDAHGRISMNFGPLNKPGGERRLNVAVTRARRRLLVIASVRADQLDLNRTRAVGVRDFRTFLDYAARGPRAIAEAAEHAGRAAFDSGFERQVYRALVARGHMVHTQVGCAGYRIDLAIVDPDAPGRYRLGIECDGATYHSAATARDRDRLRQEVLEGLGWRIHRIWSTDWWHDPAACLARAEAAIAAGAGGPDS